jgi:hypothetical protein
MAEPGNTDALTNAQITYTRTNRVDSPYDLMAGNDWHFRVRQLAINNMQVGATNTTGSNPNSDLPGSGLPIGNLLPFKGRSKFCKHHRFHAIVSFGTGDTKKADAGEHQRCSPASAYS